MNLLGYKQSEGQDGINWREELRNIGDDADVDEMTSADQFCVIYVMGVKDNALREKLLEIQNPNIEKFDRAMDAYDQAKKQLADMKRPASASSSSSSRGKNTGKTDTRRQSRGAAGGSGSNTGSNSNNTSSYREETKRREMLQGRCFRCGRADHMLPDCTQAAHRTCGICGKRGHSKGACSKNSANAAAATQPDSSLQQHMHNLSLNSPSPAYVPQPAYAPQPSQADYAGATAFTCQHPNQPTPTVLL